MASPCALMDFDDILLELGEFGRFQITTYFLVCLPILLSGANSLSYVFSAGNPRYRCLVPECDNASYPLYHQEWLSYAIPNEEADNSSYSPERCLRYVHVGTDTSCTPDKFHSHTVECDKWVFDNERTIVNDYLITCRDKQYMLSLVGNSHFIGIFLGSFTFGLLSDRYGRKYMFLFSICLMGLAGVMQILSTDYYMFVVMECIHAIGTSGVYPLGFVIGVEMVGRKKRELTGIVLNFFYAIGEAFLGVVAWLSEDWTVVHMAISVPNIIFLTYFCCIPESVRWLLANSKHQQASDVINQAAKINNVVLSQEIIDSFKTGISANQATKEEPRNIGLIVRSILKSRKLVVRYLIMFYVWAVNAFVYYGLSLNSTNMIGNKYMNFILGCLVEIPGYIISWILITKIGRKYTLIGALILCAVNCGISTFVDEKITWLIVTLFLTGKLSITASFGIIYVYTAEIFPTIVRSGGMATASTFARIGAFLAPFVPLLALYVKFLPMLLFAVIALTGGLLCFKLPETLNKKLPETVQDAIDI